MPSPFPGTDPYLEDPFQWTGVHITLIASIQATLNRALRPKYMAVIEERMYASDEPEDLPRIRSARVSNAKVLRADRPTVSGCTAIIDVPVVARTVLCIRRKERLVVVIEAGSRAVVAIIEVLSPANKRAGSRGRGNYLRKRREVLASPAALVEIDLLRDGAGFFRRPSDDPQDYGI